MDVGQPQTPRTGAQRTVEPTAGVFLEFDLNAQIEQLKCEPLGRTAATPRPWSSIRTLGSF